MFDISKKLIEQEIEKSTNLILGYFKRTIHLQRDPKIPTSLSTHTIQKYLSDLKDYKAVKTNIKLTSSISYRNWNVLETFAFICNSKNQ